MSDLDSEITEKIRNAKSTAGIDDLFTAIYPDLKKIVRGRLSSFSQNGDLQATEITHDLFFELRKVLMREGVSFENRACFFSYASKVVLHSISRSRALASRLVELPADTGVNPNQNLDQIAVQRALELLRIRYRRPVAALILYEFSGFTLEEVAQICDYKVNTLRDNLVQIRRKLREKLEEERLVGPDGGK